MNKKKTIPLNPAKAMSFVFLGVGSALLAFGGWGAVAAEKKVRTWRPVEAQVLDGRMKSSISTRKTSSGRTRSTQVYSSEYRLRYQWEGRGYERLFESGISTSRREAIESELRTYRPGTRREVWVNPAEPSEIAVNVGRNLDTYIAVLVLGGLGLSFSGMGMLVRRLA